MGYYLTFDEYKEKGGSLDSAAFLIALPFAEAKLNELTPLEKHPLSVTENVQIATAYLVDNYAVRFTGGNTGRVSSFSNDGVSVSYAQKSAKEEDMALFETIHILLPNETRLGVC